jgi:hypothetical protein
MLLITGIHGDVSERACYELPHAQQYNQRSPYPAQWCQLVEKQYGNADRDDCKPCLQEHLWVRMKEKAVPGDVCMA